MAGSKPIAWTIAGSDSGGGAGIQADLKVMNAFGVHGCSVITALTAQNSLGVSAVAETDTEMLVLQIEALTADLPPLAIKTGMLGSGAICRGLVEHIPLLDAPVICDPVLKSTSGDILLNEDALQILKEQFIPHVAILTPNLAEAAHLIGKALPVEEAATTLLELGPYSVLIKGGHADGELCRDYWTDGDDKMWLTSPRINTKATHGTGCILSSAIASAIALGQGIPDAVITAKTFLNQCLKNPANVGAGHGPMMILPFENRAEDRPVVTGIVDPGHRNPVS
jgi:hydroxymethylpyrimidine kinase/phosphomethylpyrimidine kinase/thiamine-phosphate diphosphorylase